MKIFVLDGGRTGNMASVSARLVTIVMLVLAAAGALGLSCSRRGSAAENNFLSQCRQYGSRIEKAADFIDHELSVPHVSLAIERLSARKTAFAHSQVDEVRNITFRLTGIIGSKREPLVLTSAGTAGLGEEVDGFKVVDIQENIVTFADKQGRKLNVKLYKEETVQ